MKTLKRIELERRIESRKAMESAILLTLAPIADQLATIKSSITARYETYSKWLNYVTPEGGIRDNAINNAYRRWLTVVAQERAVLAKAGLVKRKGVVCFK